MKSIDLPSGAILRISGSPFEISLALKEALIEETKSVPIASDMDVTALIKNLYCLVFSSPKIKKCVWECFKRCTYEFPGKGALKIDKDTFQPMESRQDYETVCMEVAKEELAPFGSRGFVEFAKLVGETFDSLAST